PSRRGWWGAAATWAERPRSGPASRRARRSWWREPSCSRPRPRRPVARAPAMTTEPAGPIARLIRATFAKPLLALVLILAAAVLGVASFQELRRDVFPDLSAP